MGGDRGRGKGGMEGGGGSSHTFCLGNLGSTDKHAHTDCLEVLCFAVFLRKTTYSDIMNGKQHVTQISSKNQRSKHGNQRFTHRQNALQAYQHRTFSMLEELPGMKPHFHLRHIHQKEAQTSVTSYVTINSKDSLPHQRQLQSIIQLSETRNARRHRTGR